MRYRRSQHPTQQQQTITALQEQLTEASAHIAKLETDNYSLRTFIDQLRDIEEAFRTDTRVHPLKKFLASSPYHAVRPGCVKILDPEAGIAPRGSRGTYTDIMRRAGFSADEQADVWAAWADMLKEELIKHYYTGKQS